MKKLLLAFACFVLFALPAFPQSCTVLPSQLPHAVILTFQWTQGAGAPATGFNIRRAVIPNAGTTIAPIGSLTGTTVKTFTDSGTAGNPLIEGQTYYYTVTAVGSGGESGASNEVGCTVPFSVPPSPPSALSGSVH